MIVPSLRSCLVGLPTREATAKVGQLLRCFGRSPLAQTRRHRTWTALADICDHYSVVVHTA